MNNPMQMFQQFRANPAQFIMNQRFNIPQSMMNDPNAMINHLLKTGQIDQNAVNQAYQMMGQFKR
jgi:hypothetical protein